VTAARDVAKLPEAVKFLREHLETGRQAYIVYPLIDESEKMEVKAAGVEFKKWQELLKPMSCGLLHGRIGPEEKETIMEGFRLGTTQVLVATTVIEVGIDVPNANLMLIENAERFGLAQLHQLRGRVGRGAEQSYCLLLTDYKISADTKKRIETMVRTNNGFEIAEVDLQLRGPGDIGGTRQSGAIDLMIADLAKDGEILKVARETAVAILEEDPNLTLDKNKMIREQVMKQKKDTTNWARIS
jgi:ATP-dependent DNA helicase RecG